MKSGLGFVSHFSGSEHSQPLIMEEQNFFIWRVMQHCTRLPREVLEPSPLEIQNPPVCDPGKPSLCDPAFTGELD